MNRKECYCKKALQETAGWGTVKKVCNKGKATVGEGFQPSLKVSSFIRKTREKAICPDQSNNSSRSKGGLKTLPYKGVYFFANLKRPAGNHRAFHAIWLIAAVTNRAATHWCWSITQVTVSNCQ